MVSSKGQLGDLSALAQGQLTGPSPQDLELVNTIMGRTGEMARRELQTTGDILGAQGREELTSRGVSGSSAEVLQNLLNKLGTQQSVAQSVAGAQLQGAQSLMNLPFQRAGVQLSANQELFNRILGAAGPSMQTYLSERTAQPTTTGTQTQKESGFSWSDLAGLGQMVGGLGKILL